MIACRVVKYFKWTTDIKKTVKKKIFDNYQCIVIHEVIAIK